MVTAHLESALEEHIEAHLLTHGWHQGNSTAYERVLGLDTVALLTFIGASRQAPWDTLVRLHGDPNVAQVKFERRLADELTSEGVVDVLRRGVKDLGVHIDLAHFASAHELTPDLRKLYADNRLTVTRQVHHAESNPADSVYLEPKVQGKVVERHEANESLSGILRQASVQGADAVLGHQELYDGIRQDQSEGA